MTGAWLHGDLLELLEWFSRRSPAKKAVQLFACHCVAGIDGGCGQAKIKSHHVELHDFLVIIRPVQADGGIRWHLFVLELLRT